MQKVEQAARVHDGGDQPGQASEHHKRSAVDALTDRNVRTIVALENSAKSATTAGERLAAHVATFCGNMIFVWVHLAIFAAWICYNTLPGFAPHRDPFPFLALTFVVSLEAIFLSAFILISQNEEKRLTKQRSHLNLQITLLTEQENTRMLKILNNIATKVGAEMDDGLGLATLEESTRPEKLMDQIDAATSAKV